MIQARIAKRLPGFQLDLEFQAEPGVTVLYGVSGAGKSLTLDCLAGFVAPDSGRILLDDALLFDSAARVNLPPRLRHCGYVFQDHALFPNMTVRGNLLFAAERHPRLERHRRADDTMKRFRIEEFSERYPDQLSGGQKQRCSIARALITEPRLLLLDEPARGLDVHLRNELRELIRLIRDTWRIPILLVTHDREECFALGDTVLILSAGKILQRGKPREMYEHPATGDIARLLGITNVFDAEILALDPGRNSSSVRMFEQLFTATYFPGLLLGGRVKLGVPPAELEIRTGTGPNRLAVRLVQVTELPDSVRLVFDPEIVVEVSRDEFAGREGTNSWFVEFPPGSLRLTG